MVEFATPYNGKNNIVSEVNNDPSLTDQSFKQECDIGYIIKTCQRTGQSLPIPEMSFADCTTVQQFEDAMDVVAQCKSAFASLPSSERDRFGGDVRNYLDFISRKENLKESYEKGYIDPNSVSLKDVYPEQYFTEEIKQVSGATVAEPVSSSSTVVPATGPQPQAVSQSPA